MFLCTTCFIIYTFCRILYKLHVNNGEIGVAWILDMCPYLLVDVMMMHYTLRHCRAVQLLLLYNQANPSSFPSFS